MGGSVWQGRFRIMCRELCSIHFQFMILYFPFKFLSFSSVYAYTYQYTIWIVLATWWYLILSRLALSSLVISFLICLISSYLNLILSYGMLNFVVVSVSIRLFWFFHPIIMKIMPGCLQEWRWRCKRHAITTFWCKSDQASMFDPLTPLMPGLVCIIRFVCLPHRRSAKAPVCSGLVLLALLVPGRGNQVWVQVTVGGSW